MVAEQYENLTDRQQALVDAVAELEQDLDKNDKGQVGEGQYSWSDVGELMEDMGYEPYSSSRMRKISNSVPGVIEERIIMKANERSEEEGTVKTTLGKNSYEGPEGGINVAWQDITERPTKEIGEIEEDSMDVFMLPVDRDMVFRLLRSEDEELAREVYDIIFPEE